MNVQTRVHPAQSRRNLSSLLRRPIVVAVILLTFVLGQRVQAYILRGPHLLSLMTQQYGRAKSLMVTQKVQFFGQSSGDVIAEAEETLRYVFPSAFRSDSTSQNATRIHLMSNGRTLTVIDDKIVVNDETLFDLYKDILLYRSRELLERRLTFAGVDTSLTCLGRFKGRIAVVLGAEKAQERVSQLWVDKETFRPIRWIFVSSSAETPETVMEIRYGDWRKVKRTWYPMLVGIYRDGELTREIKVAALRVNAAFPKRMFDPEYMEATYHQSVSEHQEGSVDGELSEIEKTINEFRKRIEE